MTKLLLIELGLLLALFLLLTPTRERTCVERACDLLGADIHPEPPPPHSTCYTEARAAYEILIGELNDTTCAAARQIDAKNQRVRDIYHERWLDALEACQ